MGLFYKDNQAGRNNNVFIASKRCRDVIMTLLLRHVYAGSLYMRFVWDYSMDK